MTQADYIEIHVAIKSCVKNLELFSFCEKGLLRVVEACLVFVVL